MVWILTWSFQNTHLILLNNSVVALIACLLFPSCNIQFLCSFRTDFRALRQRSKLQITMLPPPCFTVGKTCLVFGGKFEMCSKVLWRTVIFSILPFNDYHCFLMEDTSTETLASSTISFIFCRNLTWVLFHLLQHLS